MTWVIGANTIFGYGLIVSDVCVSWKMSDGSIQTKDCLQKVYPVGPSIAAGFAGSVEIGFALLEDLRQFLILPAEEQGRSGWEPAWVADNWRSRAIQIFNNFPEPLRNNGASILMVGAHPSEDIGIPGMARINVITMKAPRFDPVVTFRPADIQHIGSGAVVDEYKAAIQELVQDPGWHPSMQMEVGSPGGWGRSIAMDISEATRRSPTSGVSQHLFVGILRREGLSMFPNDRTEYPDSGQDVYHLGGIGVLQIRDVTQAIERAKQPRDETKTPAKIEFRMPTIARSYPEFVKMAQSFGLTAPEATAKHTGPRPKP